jgi:integrase
VLGGVRLKELNALHVTNALKRLEGDEVSASMRRHASVTLRAARSYAVELKLIPHNPALAVPLPTKPRHKSQGLTPEQVAAFVEAARGDRLYAMYLLAIDGGLREGELLGLTWKDVDTVRGTVTVNKALEEVGGALTVKGTKNRSSERTVCLSQATVAALKAHREAMEAENHYGPDATVFCGSRRGQHLRKSDIFRHSFAPILKKARVKFRFHDLRHASATLLLAGGVDIKTVQARLGHSAAAVTLDIYASAVDRGQQKAADTMQDILAPRPPKGKKKGSG